MKGKQNYYKIIKNFMVLEGKRVVLRPINFDDTKYILEWRNSYHVRKNFIFQEELLKEEHENWMKSYVETGKVVQFIIVAENCPIGSVYLRDIDKKNKKAEFGIFIGEKEFCGKGYAKESTELICKFGFKNLGLHKIMLRVFADNIIAINTYKKNGFKEEALLKDEFLQDGIYRDIILMAKFN